MLERRVAARGVVVTPSGDLEHCPVSASDGAVRRWWWGCLYVFEVWRYSWRVSRRLGEEDLGKSQ